MKIVLIGSVIFSRRMLNVLVREAPALNGIKTVAVFGIPPGHSRNISDYANLEGPARRAGIPYYPFHKIDSPEVLSRFAKLKPDCTFVLGLSQLLPPGLLKLTGLTIGTHPSLLPDGRGRAAIPWSILLGWKRSGISFFGITEGIDEGLIHEQEPWDIGPRDDATVLYSKMCRAGEAALKRLLKSAASGGLIGRLQGKPQIGPLARRTPADGRIDWPCADAVAIDRLIRATARPYPGAFTELAGRKVIFRKSGGVKTFWNSHVPRDSSHSESGTILYAGKGELIVSAGLSALSITEVEIPCVARLGARCDLSSVFVPGQHFT